MLKKTSISSVFLGKDYPKSKEPGKCLSKQQEYCKELFQQSNSREDKDAKSNTHCQSDDLIINQILQTPSNSNKEKDVETGLQCQSGHQIINELLQIHSNSNGDEDVEQSHSGNENLQPQFKIFKGLMQIQSSTDCHKDTESSLQSSNKYSSGDEDVDSSLQSSNKHSNGGENVESSPKSPRCFEDLEREHQIFNEIMQIHSSSNEHVEVESSLQSSNGHEEVESNLKNSNEHEDVGSSAQITSGHEDSEPSHQIFNELIQIHSCSNEHDVVGLSLQTSNGHESVESSLQDSNKHKVIESKCQIVNELLQTHSSFNDHYDSDITLQSQPDHQIVCGRIHSKSIRSEEEEFSSHSSNGLQGVKPGHHIMNELVHIHSSSIRYGEVESGPQIIDQLPQIDSCFTVDEDVESNQQKDVESDNEIMNELLKIHSKSSKNEDVESYQSEGMQKHTVHKILSELLQIVSNSERNEDVESSLKNLSDTEHKQLGFENRNLLLQTHSNSNIFEEAESFHLENMSSQSRPDLDSQFNKDLLCNSSQNLNYSLENGLDSEGVLLHSQSKSCPEKELNYHSKISLNSWPRKALNFRSKRALKSCSKKGLKFPPKKGLFSLLKEGIYCQSKKDLNSYSNGLNSQSNENLDIQLNEGMDAHLNEGMDTQLNQNMDTHSNEDVDTHSNKDVDTHSNEIMDTRLKESLKIQSKGLNSQLNEDLDTQLNEGMHTQSNEDMDTHSNEGMHTWLKENLKTQTKGLNSQLNKDLDTQLNEGMDAHLNKDMDTHSNENMDTRLTEDLKSQSNDDLHCNCKKMLFDMSKNNSVLTKKLNNLRKELKLVKRKLANSNYKNSASMEREKLISRSYEIINEKFEQLKITKNFENTLMEKFGSLNFDSLKREIVQLKNMNLELAKQHSGKKYTESWMESEIKYLRTENEALKNEIHKNVANTLQKNESPKKYTVSWIESEIKYLKAENEALKIKVHKNVTNTLQKNESPKIQIPKNNTDILEKNESPIIQIHENNTNTLQKNESLEIQIRKNKTLRKKLNNCKCVANAFNGVFTKAQQNILLGKKMVPWDGKTLSIAFALKNISLPAYNFLRSTINYPLPSLESLSDWAVPFQLSRGLLVDVFKMLKTTEEQKLDYQRLVVLAFGEMKINEVCKRRRTMNVVMARALFGAWKLPLYVDFDQVMSEEILFLVVGTLYQVGYNVVACVSDTSETNIDLWEKLGVTEEKSWCTNPVTGDNIYFFADVTHLLQLIGNSLLNIGFNIDGVVVNKDPLLKYLMNYSKKDKSYLTSRNSSILFQMPVQNVQVTFDLFSDVTVKALEQLESDQMVSVKLAEFIKKANGWFSVLDSTEFKCCYGLSSFKYNQNTIIDQFCQTVKSINCINNADAQVFQKGVLLSSFSLKCLFEDIASKYVSAQSIVTRRLSLESVRNMFSNMRGNLESNNHVTLPNALHRMKTIVLSEIGYLMCQNADTGDQDINYLTEGGLVEDPTDIERSEETELDAVYSQIFGDDDSDSIPSGTARVQIPSTKFPFLLSDVVNQPIPIFCCGPLRICTPENYFQNTPLGNLNNLCESLR